MTSSPSDKVRIFIRDCRVNLKIGIFDHELKRTQPVVITVECEAILDSRFDDLTNKDLSRVINYKPIYHFLREELPLMGHIFLLESVAEHILTFCFSDPRVTKASVRIEKTAIFPDAAGAGVELSRCRV